MSLVSHWPSLCWALCVAQAGPWLPGTLSLVTGDPALEPEPNSFVGQPLRRRAPSEGGRNLSMRCPSQGQWRESREAENCLSWLWRQSYEAAPAGRFQHLLPAWWPNQGLYWVPMPGFLQQDFPMADRSFQGIHNLLGSRESPRGTRVAQRTQKPAGGNEGREASGRPGPVKVCSPATASPLVTNPHCPWSLRQCLRSDVELIIN
jgi:hypothetical protein